MKTKLNKYQWFFLLINAVSCIVICYDIIAMREYGNAFQWKVAGIDAALSLLIIALEIKYTSKQG